MIFIHISQNDGLPNETTQFHVLNHHSSEPVFVIYAWDIYPESNRPIKNKRGDRSMPDYTLLPFPIFFDLKSFSLI